MLIVLNMLQQIFGKVYHLEFYKLFYNNTRSLSHYDFYEAKINSIIRPQPFLLHAHCVVLVMVHLLSTQDGPFWDHPPVENHQIMEYSGMKKINVLCHIQSKEGWFSGCIRRTLSNGTKCRLWGIQTLNCDIQ